MDFISRFKERARSNKKTIVLPEGLELRTLKAANIVLEEGIANLSIIGNPAKIREEAEKENLFHLLEKAKIIDPTNHEKLESYAKIVYDLRKHKGVTFDKAIELVKNPLYLGVTMIKAGDADGEVAGAQNTTGDVLRPGFQLIKTIPGVSIVSGIFIMVLKDKEFGDDGVMLFADCAVNPDPDEHQLAEIAIATALTAKNLLGMKPRVGMLSFSTKGSANHPHVDKVANATRIAHELNPDLNIDGELQLDAAIIPEVAAKKAPGSEIAGKANVLIFPTLQAGNIAYKLVQRFAHADAYGPVLQGLAAPINDLSRGCFVHDIVNLIAITANQAIDKE
ncbi:MAG: phosphate acetyltransferase [Bacteroidales bacterium]|nr:phosphate acetyltransferase [Bacteroidales bacterium]